MSAVDAQLAAALQALTIALMRVPEHRIVVSRAALLEAQQRLGDSGGLLTSIEPDGRSWRLADSEDRTTLIERARRAGGLVIEDGAAVIGIIPQERPDAD